MKLTTFAILSALVSAPRAQAIVKDINAEPSTVGLISSAKFVAADGKVFFTASDRVWVADSPNGEATLLWGQSVSLSDPDELTPAGAGIYFAAKTKAAGRELWWSDGTPAGTTLVADPLHEVGIGPEDLLYADGLVWFSAYTADVGRELWVSDGTAAGTYLVADVNVGPGDSDPEPLGVVGGALLFAAETPALGRELWRSDGTAAGTWLVADLSPNFGMLLDYSDQDDVPIVFDDRLFFAGSDGVFPGNDFLCSDGTAAGTITLASGGSPRWLTAFDGRVFCERSGDLFATDGTPGGSGAVKFGGTPQQLAVGGTGELFFSATTGAAGRELWKSDGTTPGTVLVADTLPGSAGGIEGVNTSTPIATLTSVAGGIVFEATDSLWFSDGTGGGTTEVLVGSPGTALKYFASSLGKAWFYFDDPLVDSTWCSDGTLAGSFVVTPEDIPPTTQASSPNSLAPLGDQLVFAATEFVHGRELWISDGTEGGTQLLKDIYSDEDSNPSLTTYFRGRVWFTAQEREHGRELWSTDGTEAGTRLFLEFTPGEDDSDIRHLTAIGDRLYFTLHDPDFPVEWHELWATDGTVAGTVQLAELASAYTPYFQPFEDVVLFAKDDDLWKTDGTVAGTQFVADSVPAGFGAVLGGELLFAATVPGQGTELWRTDGTTAGTVLVAELFPGSHSGVRSDVVAAHGRAYFGGDDDVHGIEMWSTDGTAPGTSMVADGNPGAADGLPFAGNDPVLADDRVFWRTATGNGLEDALWVSDGAAGGDEVLRFCNSFRFLEPAGSGRLVLFDADDGVIGHEMWISDGTTAGTQPVADLAPFDLDSSPDHPQRVGGRVYFSAGFHFDTELWAVELDELGGWATGPLGHGCGASAAPELTSSGAAQLGGTLTALAESAPPGSVGVLLYTLSYAPLELGDCVLFPALDLGLAGALAADGAGDAALVIPIPNKPALLGFPIYFQALFVEPGGPFLGVGALSNALEMVAGPN